MDKITIAVGDMQKMIPFYEGLLSTTFQSFERFGGTLYGGRAGDLELLFCPKEIAGIDANINTIQLRFVVPDVAAAYSSGMQNGGMSLSGVQDTEGSPGVSLRDPDGNSLELTQHR